MDDNNNLNNEQPTKENGIINIGSQKNSNSNNGNGKKNPLSNLPPQIRNKLFIIIALFVIIGFLMIKGMVGGKKHQVKINSNATNSTLQLNNNAVLQKQILQKISQIANATSNNTKNIHQLQSVVKQMANSTSNLPPPANLPTSTPSTPSQPPPQPQQIVTPPPPPPQPARIHLINITAKSQPQNNETKSNNENATSQNNNNYVSLPDGSVVSVTVVSGIYAPITSGQYLPTLLNVNEMFYGPNHTRIPLKACKVLAKAQGNQATERAFVNATELSCVLPNGKSEHFAISGYLSAKQDSAYGIKGKIISVTGKYITGSFLAGVLQGFGQAMSMANQNSSLTSSGTVETSVNGGQVGKYSGYAGLAGGANALSQYYSNKLNSLVDMIYVPAGTKAYLVVEKGAVIKGYKLNSINQYGFKGVD